jgi:hypothetical protein
LDRVKLRVKKAVVVGLGIVDADVDVNAEAAKLCKQQMLKLKWEVDVVDAIRVNPVVALESTPADTAGEFL